MRVCISAGLSNDWQLNLFFRYFYFSFAYLQVSSRAESPFSPGASHATIRDVERTQNMVGASLAQPTTHAVFNGKLLDVAIWNM
jgi:hypothetical protein